MINQVVHHHCGAYSIDEFPTLRYAPKTKARHGSVFELTFDVDTKINDTRVGKAQFRGLFIAVQRSRLHLVASIS